MSEYNRKYREKKKAEFEQLLTHKKEVVILENKLKINEIKNRLYKKLIECIIQKPNNSAQTIQKVISLIDAEMEKLFETVNLETEKAFTPEHLVAIKEVSDAIDQVLLINELTKQKKGVDSEVKSKKESEANLFKVKAEKVRGEK